MKKIGKYFLSGVLATFITPVWSGSVFPEVSIDDLTGIVTNRTPDSSLGNEAPEETENSFSRMIQDMLKDQKEKNRELKEWFLEERLREKGVPIEILELKKSMENAMRAQNELISLRGNITTGHNEIMKMGPYS
ncbi:MAG: hypothetical protein GY915_00665 [bacterium]|nr:hypothetical protein [bacterium]